MNKPNLQTWRGRMEWIQAQAQIAYRDDGMVDHAKIWQPAHDVPPTSFHSLSDAFNMLACIAPDFGNLAGNRAMVAWLHLSASIKTRMDAFVADHGYTDLSYLGNGGRAVALRTRHTHSGEMRVVRVEPHHECRQPRPNHPTVLQPWISNEGILGDFDQVRIEVLPEIVPLTRLPARRFLDGEGGVPTRVFNTVILALSWATNTSYPQGWFDYDAEPQNVGVRFSGQVASFDPEIFMDAAACKRRRAFERQTRAPRGDVWRHIYGA